MGLSRERLHRRRAILSPCRDRRGGAVRTVQDDREVVGDGPDRERATDDDPADRLERRHRPSPRAVLSRPRPPRARAGHPRTSDPRRRPAAWPICAISRAVRDAMHGVDAVVHAGAIPIDIGDGADGHGDERPGHVERAAGRAGGRRPARRQLLEHQRPGQRRAAGGPPTACPSTTTIRRIRSRPYQLSKHLGEEICRSFSERHGHRHAVPAAGLGHPARGTTRAPASGPSASFGTGATTTGPTWTSGTWVMPCCAACARGRPARPVPARRRRHLRHRADERRWSTGSSRRSPGRHRDREALPGP